jgi:hypothetical protein
MRVLRLLILASAAIATPALADCQDQRLVFQPSSGKLGFRVEIAPANADGERKALVYRPFRSVPDTYRIVTEQPSGSGSRYVLSGPAGTLRFDVSDNGTAEVEANREIPSRWRLACK